MNRPPGIPPTWKQADGTHAPLVRFWAYQPEKDGPPLGYVARYENGSGKEIRPFFKPGQKPGTFSVGMPDAPRPLFGLDTLTRAGPILITEGEKDATALHLLGLCALSSLGGSQSPGKADWEPVIRANTDGRRPVVIWPDRDEPGRDYAVAVEHCIGNGCECLSPPPQRTPQTKGAGAADWLHAELIARSLGPWDELAPLTLPDEHRVGVREALLAAVHAVKGPLPEDWVAKYTPERKPRRKHRQGPDEAETQPYVAIDRGIFRVSADGERQLCNFAARITEEVSRDDGQDSSLSLTVEGKRAGTALPTVSMRLEQFMQMTWPMKHWGTSCMVFPGNAVKDHLRHAIQYLSHRDGEVTRHTVYTHTGWRQLPDGWVYLSAGTVVGAQGTRRDIVVDLGELGELYRLPEPSTTPEEAVAAAKASMESASIAPPEIAVPLIACVYLTPLARHLRADFALWLEGPSRSMKSTLAGVMAAHFGSGIERTALTASWLDTPNAIGFKLFTLADCLAVIDDYAPQPSAGDQARLDKSVHTIVRSIGNRAGRGRLTQDIRLQNSRRPRALTVCTAEQWPHGESVNARLFGVSIKPGDIDKKRMTLSQGAARDGLLARAMADHLQRIAPCFEYHRDQVAANLDQWQKTALSHGLTGRTPDQAAYLLVGYGEALDHWRASGIITEREAASLLEVARVVVFELARRHERRILSSQPADAFRTALSDLLLSGGAHLYDRAGKRPDNAERYGWKGGRPEGQHIGWIFQPEGIVYLLENQARQAVNDLLRRVDTPLNIRPDALRRQLRDRGFLMKGATEERDGRTIQRTTCKISIQGKRKSVLAMPETIIFPAEPCDDRSE